MPPAPHPHVPPLSPAPCPSITTVPMPMCHWVPKCHQHPHYLCPHAKVSPLSRCPQVSPLSPSPCVTMSPSPTVITAPIPSPKCRHHSHCPHPIPKCHHVPLSPSATITPCHHHSHPQVSPLSPSPRVTMSPSATIISVIYVPNPKCHHVPILNCHHCPHPIPKCHHVPLSPSATIIPLSPSATITPCHHHSHPQVSPLPPSNPQSATIIPTVPIPSPNATTIPLLSSSPSSPFSPHNVDGLSAHLPAAPIRRGGSRAGPPQGWCKGGGPQEGCAATAAALAGQAAPGQFLRGGHLPVFSLINGGATAGRFRGGRPYGGAGQRGLKGAQRHLGGL